MSHPDEKILKLRKPITLKGDSVTYDALTLREPTVDELDRCTKAGDSHYAQDAALIAFVSGVPTLVVRELGKRDFEEARAFLAGFTWDGPETGKA